MALDLPTQLDLAARHVAAADRHRREGSQARAWIHELAARNYLRMSSDALGEKLETNPTVQIMALQEAA
ncbi:MAG: hypothetical protein ACTSX7_04690 [Alphaproteobacteria bacterium]